MKRKLTRDRDWFDRTSVAKKRKEESSNKQAAAASLLQLSQAGNGTDYCDPHTGTCSMTDLTMKDLQQAETDKQNLLVQLQNEKETLLPECKALRV